MNRRYKAYLWSAEWVKKSRQYKYDRKHICEMCGNHLLLEVTELIRDRHHPSWQIPELARFVESGIEAKGDENNLIQIHHRSYKNLGHELPGDLACVCRICHVLISENTHNGDLKEAWDITQNRVNEILAVINNIPDGGREFASFIPFEENKTNRDEELEEAINEYYEYQNEFYETKQEFE